MLLRDILTFVPLQNFHLDGVSDAHQLYRLLVQMGALTTLQIKCHGQTYVGPEVILRACLPLTTLCVDGTSCMGVLESSNHLPVMVMTKGLAD